MMKFRFFYVAFLVFLCAACEKNPVEVKAPVVASSESHPGSDWQERFWSSYEVVRELPHDSMAFTQGLLLSEGDWIESTGGYGTSSIRRVDKSTGRVIMKRDLAENFFGEGVVELNGKLFQLTWMSQQGFVYDAMTLEQLGKFSYEGEGWGLTTDGKSLIMSDGTDRLRYLDPVTFRVIREVLVTFNGKPVEMLNELEFVEGEIFANIWHADQILRIAPTSGKVVGVIDLTGIDAKEKRRDQEHVLNGIAYDPVARELFVTGKCWPKIYQIRLVPKTRSL